MQREHGNYKTADCFPVNFLSNQMVSVLGLSVWMPHPDPVIL